MPVQGDTAQPAGGETITGFTTADTLTLTGFAATSAFYDTGTGLLLSSGGSSAILSITGDFTGDTFVTTSFADETVIQLVAVSTIGGTVTTGVTLGSGGYDTGLRVNGTIRPTAAGANGLTVGLPNGFVYNRGSITGGAGAVIQSAGTVGNDGSITGGGSVLGSGSYTDQHGGTGIILSGGSALNFGLVAGGVGVTGGVGAFVDGGYFKNGDLYGGGVSGGGGYNAGGVGLVLEGGGTFNNTSRETVGGGDIAYTNPNAKGRNGPRRQPALSRLLRRRHTIRHAGRRSGRRSRRDLLRQCCRQPDGGG